MTMGTVDKEMRGTMSLPAFPVNQKEIFGDKKMQRNNATRSHSVPPANKIVVPSATPKYDIENFFRQEVQKAEDPYPRRLISSADAPMRVKSDGCRTGTDDDRYPQDPALGSKVLPCESGLPPPPPEQDTSSPPNPSLPGKWKVQWDGYSLLPNDQPRIRPSLKNSKPTSKWIQELAELPPGADQQSHQQSHTIPLDIDGKAESIIPEVDRVVKDTPPKVNGLVSSAISKISGEREDFTSVVNGVVGSEQVSNAAGAAMVKSGKRKATAEAQDPSFLEGTSEEKGAAMKRRKIMLRPSIAGKKSVRHSRSVSCAPRETWVRETRFTRSFAGVVE